MPVVELRGCRPQPLGSYLKALAVLRLVSRQKDPESRGWWERDCFRLESEMDEQGLLRFFLNEYTPTPVVAPWNGGSGFYPKDRKVGIDGIAGTEDERFREYAGTIRIARSIREVGEGKASKPAEEDIRRQRIQQECRNRFPDAAVDWLDAAVVVTAEGKRAFPPILGTGGNEGRLDYTNNFMENLVKLLVKPDKKLPAAELLANALLAVPTAGLEKAAVGQYDPGRAGGFNQGQEVETKGIPVNPWNFVLTLEGAVGWASGLHRRQGTQNRSYLASPFTVHPSTVGFNSAAEKDQSSARAEIWVPVWERPATFREIELLLREGRAELKRGPAKTGLEFAEAAASLGVDRGIKGFVRYSLLKRRGDSYVALPAGQFGVRERKSVDLLEQAAPFLDRVERFLHGFRDSPPLDVASARRGYEDAVYEFLLKGGEGRFRRMAASLGRLQRAMLLRGEVSRLCLSERWIEACGGGPEVRIAAAVAGIDRIQSSMIRGGGGFAWEGNDLAGRMRSVLSRRVLDARREGAKRSPLRSVFVAPPADVSKFLRSQIDEKLLENLLFAFTLVRRSDSEGFRQEWNRQWVEEEAVLPSYCQLRLLFDPVIETKGEPRVLPLLRAGRVGEACKLAARRLAASEIPVVRAAFEDYDDGPRLAAALLVPVRGIQYEAERAGVLVQEDQDI